MQITSFPVPPGPGQDEELRRLAVVATELGGTYDIYEAPRLGEGGKSLFACCPIQDNGSPDPLWDEFNSFRYLFEDDVAAKAGAIKLPPCR